MTRRRHAETVSKRKRDLLGCLQGRTQVIDPGIHTRERIGDGHLGASLKPDAVMVIIEIEAVEAVTLGAVIMLGAIQEARMTCQHIWDREHVPGMRIKGELAR